MCDAYLLAAAETASNDTQGNLTEFLPILVMVESEKIGTSVFHNIQGLCCPTYWYFLSNRVRMNFMYSYAFVYVT